MKKSTIPARLLWLALVLAATSPLSSAQYVWIDGKGAKQYSDMPPPSAVPSNRILKSPGVVAPSDPAEPAAAPSGDPGMAASSTAPTQNSVPMTTAERNADYTKRKMEAAEKAKKSAEADKLAADKKTNCERARAYSRSLEDGVRITNTDKNGERSYMTDAQRAQEIRETQRVIADCK